MQRPDPQQGYRFQNQQPYQHRFPQNQPQQFVYEQQPVVSASMQQQPAAMPVQQPWLHDSSACAQCPYRKNMQMNKRRKKFSVVRFGFTLIGVVTVFVLLIRYIIIPFLVYLNTLTGGAL